MPARGWRWSTSTLQTARSPESPRPGPGQREAGVIDQNGGQVWTGLVDLHTHLDKGHIWPRAENPDGTYGAALEASRADRLGRWSTEDVPADRHHAARLPRARHPVLM
jgi:cytosine deaminase